MEACRIFDNQGGTKAGGLWLTDAALALNTLIFRNTASEGGGAVVQQASLRYSTVANNTATLQAGGVLAETDAMCEASIIYFNSAPNHAQVDAAEPSANFHHIACPDPLPGTGHVTGNPLFVDSAKGDYRLSYGSSCIDAAPEENFPLTDIDRHVRPNNGNADAVVRADMGAHENVAVHYVDIHSTNPTRPFSGWATAAVKIQDAVDACQAGGVVLVAPGTYPLTSAVMVNSSVRLISTEGPETTILNGQNTTRCVVLSNAGASLDGFTIQNGRSVAGAGVYVRFNGTVRNCIIRNNVSTGDLGGLFEYLRSNFPNPCTANLDSYLKEGGGGVVLSSGGLLENSLVYSNSAARAAGVLMTRGGEMRHCTVADNTASVDGGGAALVDGGLIANSILWGNMGGASSNVFIQGNGSSIHHTCSTPLPAGEHNTQAAPGWNGASDLYRLPANSPLLDQAEPSALRKDLLGAPRPHDGDGDGVALPDPGAWEYIRTPGDSDGDGLTDEEEQILGTDPYRADSDGDHVPDPEELELETDPLHATSYIKITPLTLLPENSGVTIRWRSVPYHVYSISRGTNLLTGFSGYIATNLPPTSPWNEYTDPDYPGHGSVFYRIEGHDPE